MDYEKIEFKDEFEADNETCDVCGCDAMARVGYNEKKDLLKFECPECKAVFIEDGTGNTTMIKGTERKWGSYLAENLVLPFEAVVVDASFEEVFGFGRHGPIRYKDILTVLSVVSESESRGVLVSVKKGRRKYKYPLCDLEPTDKASANAKILSNYGNWLGCRYL